MDKKSYSKPMLVAEIFMPQEFCAPCEWIKATEDSLWFDTPLTSFPGYPTYRYVDLDGDGKYSSGEQFNVSTGKATSVFYGEITNTNVRLYGLGRSNNRNYSSPSEFTGDTSALIGQTYWHNGSAFKVGSYYYKFPRSNGTRYVKIEEGTLYLQSSPRS